MARSSNQKQKILYIEKMFREESDELHALTVAGIQEKLERLGITAERKALYSDIETLRDILGMDICSDKNGTYYLASRDFEFEELQLLADAVACSARSPTLQATSVQMSFSGALLSQTV